jgi:hypothetical protein
VHRLSHATQDRLNKIKKNKGNKGGSEQEDLTEAPRTSLSLSLSLVQYHHSSLLAFYHKKRSTGANAGAPAVEQALARRGHAVRIHPQVQNAEAGQG